MTTPPFDPEQHAQPRQPAAGAPKTVPARPVGPRTSPIIWGTLILVFCGYIAQRTFGGVRADDSLWIIGTVMGLGLLLLGVGLTVILRNRRR